MENAVKRAPSHDFKSWYAKSAEERRSLRRPEMERRRRESRGAGMGSRHRVGRGTQQSARQCLVGGQPHHDRKHRYDHAEFGDHSLYGKHRYGQSEESEPYRQYPARGPQHPAWISRSPGYASPGVQSSRGNRGGHGNEGAFSGGGGQFGQQQPYGHSGGGAFGQHQSGGGQFSQPRYGQTDGSHGPPSHYGQFGGGQFIQQPTSDPYGHQFGYGAETPIPGREMEYHNFQALKSQVNENLGPRKQFPPIDEERRGRSPGLQRNFYDVSTADFKRPHGT